MHPMLNIAVRAARSAGDIIVRAASNRSSITVNQKGLNDFATEVDRQAENEIINIIKSAYPNHAIMAEESGEHKGDDYIWVIDPLDGTKNFIHDFPQYSISIALINKGKTEIGVVFDPIRDELFTATRGSGATLNNRRIRVNQQTNLQGALIGTGFPFRRQQHLNSYLSMFKAVFSECSDIRRAGSAALDLAYVASGRLDGFWEIGLNQWDMAAGVLLIQEAGGVATDFSFKDKYMESGNIIVGNPKVHQHIYKAIEPFVTDKLK